MINRCKTCMEELHTAQDGTVYGHTYGCKNEVLFHCSGCVDKNSEGTHAGHTIEHGHVGCEHEEAGEKLPPEVEKEFDLEFRVRPSVRVDGVISGECFTDSDDRMCYINASRIKSFLASALRAERTRTTEEIINILESNPNEDGSQSPNLQHWIEKKQSQLRKQKCPHVFVEPRDEWGMENRLCAKCRRPKAGDPCKCGGRLKQKDNVLYCSNFDVFKKGKPVCKAKTQIIQPFDVVRAPSPIFEKLAKKLYPTTKKYKTRGTAHRMNPARRKP